MANNIKLDISGMVQQVEDLNKALEQLGVLAQGVFGTLGRAADVFGGKMSSASQSTAASSAPSMISSAGQTASSEFDASITRGLRAAAIAKAGVNAPGSPFVTNSPDPSAMILEKRVDASGNKFHITGFTQSNLQQAIIDGEAARLQREMQARQSAQAQSQPASFVPQANVTAAFGYGAKDIARLTGQAPGVENLSRSLSDLSANLSGSNKEVARALGMLQTDLKQQFQSFQTSLAAFGAAEGDDAQKRAMAELTQAMRKLDDTITEAQEAEMQARQLAGGGGGVGGGGGGMFGGMGFMDMLRRFGPAAFGAAATIGTGVLGAEVALRQATAGKQLDLMQSESSIAQQTFKMATEANDMTKAENLLMYRGDILFPGRFQYLGAQGMRNAFGAAAQIHEQQMALMRAERNLGAFGAGVGVIGGLGAAAGSIMTGGAIGAVGSIFGLNQAMSSLSGGLRDYYTNPLTLAEGGLTGTFMGRTLGRMSGLSMEEMRMAEVAGKRRMDQEQFSAARAIQELELQRNPTALVGMQELLDRQRAQQQGGLLVGRYAASMNTFDRTLTGPYAKGFERRQAAIAAAENDKAALEAKIAGIEMPELAGSALTMPAGTGLAMRSRAELQDKIRIRKFEAEQRLEAAKNLPVTGEAGMSPAARLGMSTAEFMLSSSQLANYVGGGISADRLTGMGATTDFLRLSKGGFGSFEQILGQLGGVNAVAGGENNTNRVMNMFAAAVSAGFDKSRMANQFVQTSTELSRVIQSTSPDEVAKRLSFTASALSATGRADERSLAEAARGMAEFSAYTASGTGAMGSLKLMGAYAGGAVMGTGAAMTATSNAEQLMEYQRQLDSGNITDPRLQRIVRLSGGIEGAKRQISGSLQSAMSIPASVMALTMQGNERFRERFGGASVSEILSQNVNLTGRARQEFIQTMMDLASESSSAAGLSEAGGMAAMSAMMGQAGFGSPADRKALNTAINQGLGKTVTTAEQNLRRFIDNLYGRERADMQRQKVSREEYRKAVGEYNVAPIEVGGRELTADILSDMEAKAAKGDKSAEAFLSKADAAIGNMDRLQLAQSARNSLSAMTGDQRVYVTNLADMGYWLKNLEVRIAK